MGGARPCKSYRMAVHIALLPRIEADDVAVPVRVVIPLGRD